MGEACDAPAEAPAEAAEATEGVMESRRRVECHRASRQRKSGSDGSRRQGEERQPKVLSSGSMAWIVSISRKILKKKFGRMI